MNQVRRHVNLSIGCFGPLLTSQNETQKTSTAVSHPFHAIYRARDRRPEEQEKGRA